MDPFRAALGYAELGYAVFPCAPGRKQPLTARGFLDASTDTQQIEAWWSKHPNANIAIPTAGLIVIDVDGPDNSWLADDHDRLNDLARGVIAVTPRGGRHYIFRAPECQSYRCQAGRLAPRVDIRADGGYILVPPSQVGGKPYRFVEGLELDQPRERLPAPPDWLVAELDRLATSSPTTPRVAAGVAVANQIPSGQRNATLARLGGTMRRVGMSRVEISAALNRANLDRCSPPLSPAEVERIAESVVRYEPDQISVAITEDHWAQLWADEAKPATVVDPGPFPMNLLRVPGLIGEVMQYNLATAFRPQPVLALASAICLQAVLAARKVRDERGNRTNVYVIGIADTGRGKDHGRKVNKSVLFHAGVDYLDGNEEIASDSGLVAAAELQPGILFQLDEFGRFLRTIGDPKKAPHLFNVISTLMKLYSSADTTFRGKAYADPKRNKVIDQPCVSLYGTTVPEHFFESLTTDGLSDGFVARLLVFEAPDVAERQRRPLVPPPDSIIEAARWWGEFRPGGDLREQHPQPIVIEATSDGDYEFDELARIVDQELAGPDSDARALWARAEEKACRLAMIYACSKCRDQPLVDGEAAKWACDLSAYITRRMLWLAKQWVADGQFDAKQKKLLRIIRSAGGKIGRNELCRKSQSLSVRERSEIIDNLKATGQIVETTESNGTGRPRLIYQLN